MTEKKAYTYDGHGYSNHSKGISTPEEIVLQAHLNKVDCIGLSDLNTTKGLPSFLAAADKLNAEGLKILAIPGIEVTTKEGQLLISVPDRDAAENFITTFKPKKDHAIRVIEEAVRKYNAICTLLHPNFPLLNSFSYPAIEFLAQCLSKETHLNTAIQVESWSNKIFLGKYAEFMNGTLIRNQKRWRFSPVSASSYLSAQDIGKAVTKLSLNNLNSTEFTKTFQEQETEACESEHMKVAEFLKNVGLKALQFII